MAALAGVMLLPAAAQADFHFIKIREIYPGGAANSSYVVLQMYAFGQTNLAPSHHIDVYGATGVLITTFTFSSDVSNGANQATVLVADTAYSTAFSGGPAPDATHAGLDIPASGGAACFDSPDCVSWGSFTGSLPSAGTPALPSGVMAGKALHRSIAPGCSTLLEPQDDSNDSATDFFEQEPNPRSNSSPIVEEECNAPNTTITSATVPNGGRTSNTAISFEFTATPSAGASFECSLDGAVFEDPCTSPQAYTSLDGDDSVSGTPHNFRVRAKNENGTDPTPATHNWTVDTVAPTMTITDQPADPSPGGSAAFSYQADESVTGTQCRLDTPGGLGTFEGCPSGGKTYTGLSDGLHTFMVRATDLAGNQSTPAAFPAGTYSWTVDNSLADTTPPETKITSMPPNPSESSTASFAYSSNEPGSTFECKLDATPFAGCPDTGITYNGLADGTRTFQVQARDPSGNVDPTPAGYTFDVVAPSLLDAPPPLPPPPTSADAPPGTAFAAGVARVRGALALLRMRCRGQQGARCKGNLRLIARVGSARSSRKGSRNLTIGSTRYSLPAGGPQRTVRARLTGQGRQLLRRAGGRGLRVSLVGRHLKNRALTLRAASHKAQANRRGGDDTRRAAG
ncbi:MAG: hypothetical protein WD404_03545 [Solirubrobacterales bacterium]